MLICLTGSCLFATVTAQRTNFMWPWMLWIPLWKSTRCRGNPQLVSKSVFCHDPTSETFPSAGFTISALSFMYTIWEIALQWGEEIYKQIQHNQHPGEPDLQLANKRPGGQIHIFSKPNPNKSNSDFKNTTNAWGTQWQLESKRLAGWKQGKSSIFWLHLK